MINRDSLLAGPLHDVGGDHRGQDADAFPLPDGPFEEVRSKVAPELSPTATGRYGVKAGLGPGVMEEEFELVLGRVQIFLGYRGDLPRSC